jgi:hypothetical protein
MAIRFSLASLQCVPGGIPTARLKCLPGGNVPVWHSTVPIPAEWLVALLFTFPWLGQNVQGFLFYLAFSFSYSASGSWPRRFRGLVNFTPPSRLKALSNTLATVPCRTPLLSPCTLLGMCVLGIFNIFTSSPSLSGGGHNAV